MKARMHLLKTDNPTSLLVKAVQQKGEPLFIRFEETTDENKDKLQGYDLLTVCTPKVFNEGDLCLINVNGKYVVDILVTVIETNFDKIFVGERATVSSIQNVEFIVASTDHTHGFESLEVVDGDSIIPEIDGHFIAKYIYEHNTGEAITDVEVETVSQLDQLPATFFQFNSLSDVIDAIIGKFDEPIIVNENNTVNIEVAPKSTNFLGWSDAEIEQNRLLQIEERKALKKRSETLTVGDITVFINGRGRVDGDIAYDKFIQNTLTYPQLKEIFEFINSHI